MRGQRWKRFWAGLAEEIRRLILQACCAAGGLAGLWFGFFAAPKRPTDPAFLPALGEVLVPIAQYVAAGVLGGAIAAWLLSRAFPWLRGEPG